MIHTCFTYTSSFSNIESDVLDDCALLEGERCEKACTHEDR